MSRYLRKLLITSLVVICGLATNAQERKVSFGFQAEPIIPTRLFRITTDVTNVLDSISGNEVSFSSTPRYGYAFGAILKFDFSQNFSFETGINYLVRSYKIEVNEPGYKVALKFNEDSYEIPLTAKYFIRLGENLYLGNSAGLSMIFIPGSLQTKAVKGAESDPDHYRFEQHSYIRRTMVPAFKGGFGLNFRFEDQSQLYLETHYRLFSVFYDTRLLYFNASTRTNQQNIRIKSIGDYFGFSIKYTLPPTQMIARKKMNK